MPNTTPERGPGVNIAISVLVILSATAAAWFARDAITGFFQVTPYLNGFILIVFAIGLIYAFTMLFFLRRETEELESIRKVFSALGETERMSDTAIRDLRPSFARERLLIYCELARRGCPPDSSSHVDKVHMKLSLHTGITRYLTSLLVFLGLLGTFVGLLLTLGEVREVIQSQTGDFDDKMEFVRQLIRDLNGPLEGMATAFTTSVFGMVTSLFLGFLHLQVASAQTGFIARLESLDNAVFRPAFLHDSTAAALSVAGGESGGLTEAIARYMEASQRQMKDNLERLLHLIDRTEGMQSNFRETLGMIGDQMETTNTAIAALSANQDLIREALGRIADLSRVSDENQKLSLAQLKAVAEALGRQTSAQRTAQKANEDFYKDMILALRQETGAIQKSMIPQE